MNETVDGMKSSTASAGNVVRHLKVAIIGAGLSGIGLGMRLRQSGEQDFLIFEKAEALGGTWFANSYPGVECDIYTHLYSYSFAPKKDWSKNYGSRDELLDYLDECAESSGLKPHFKFSHELLDAVWNAELQHWELDTSHGRYSAQVLVSAMGYLSFPNRPDLPGLENFEGPCFHSAEWDHSASIEDKKVAIVGTGASSIQIIPEIQPVVQQLDVYQRTPAWLMPKHDHEVTGFGAWARDRMPGYHKLKRFYHFITAEMVPYQYGRPSRTYFMKNIAQKHLDKSVENPALAKKLQPDYAIGCKRILFSDTFYPAMQKPNVELVQDGIQKIEANGIVTSDGTHRDADILILATGFKANRLPFAERLTGASGLRLSDVWKDGQFAYLGTTVPGFPNMFIMLGPNTTISHTSMTIMMEAQLEYVLDALRVMANEGVASVDVKQDVAEEYNDEIQTRLEPTVWNSGGCQSYFRRGEGSGRNTSIWPNTTIEFRKRTRHFDVAAYEITTSSG